MNRISLTAFCLSLAAVACLQPPSAFAEPIQWVIVGDPGNTADTAPSGYGAVATSFLGSVLALVLGSLGLLERRRLKAA